ncbi:MAG: hypothetical protein P9M11_06750, partial [Candidatus Tenebribacter burtonii]|nr:hypothetical protein [Candidatus Tenebribacter burtonii]
MKKKGLTNVSVLRVKEKQEEHRTRQTLINIPLRSMLINGGVPLLKDSQPYQSGTSFNTTST